MIVRHWLRIGVLSAFVTACGCGSSGMPNVGRSSTAESQAKGVQAAQMPGAPADVKEAAEGFQRKIIYRATLDVLVSDFDAARAKLEALYAEAGGYVEKSEFTGSVGAKRMGAWTLRVPVEKFHTFVAAVAGLGQPQKHATEAQDVTEEYVDTGALIKSLKEEEETLNKLLKEQAKNLADIVTWKEKVALVRRDLARNEARLQTLGRLSAMATVNVTLRDEKEYLPNTDPAYGATAGKTLEDSWKALKGFGETIFIGLVALLPWLPLIVVAGFLIRRAWKRQRAWPRQHVTHTPAPHASGE
jgi:hypothetical protein